VSSRDAKGQPAQQPFNRRAGQMCAERDEQSASSPGSTLDKYGGKAVAQTVRCEESNLGVSSRWLCAHCQKREGQSLMSYGPESCAHNGPDQGSWCAIQMLLLNHVFLSRLLSCCAAVLTKPCSIQREMPAPHPTLLLARQAFV